MNTHRISMRSAALCLGGFCFLFLLLRNASVAMDGVRQGLSLCAEVLLPSLFPFLVLSELLIAMGAGRLLGRFLARPVAFFFGVSPDAAAPILLGALCGQPVATATAVTAYDRGELSRAELERISLFANNPSSGFLVGAVGEAFFGSGTVGSALFVITLLSGAAIGMLLRIFGGSLATPNAKKPPNGGKNDLGAALFTDSVRRALFTFLQIAAFLLFFSCISRCVAAYCEAWATPSAVRVALFGLLEMTTGISAAVTTFPPVTAFRFCAFFSSFAGLSVCLQIFSIAQGRGIRFAPYLTAKLAQGTIALLLAEGYLRFFCPDFKTTESILASTATTLTPLVFLPCTLLALAILLTARSKRPTHRTKP